MSKLFKLWSEEWKNWQFKLLVVSAILLAGVWFYTQQLDVKLLSTLTLPFILRELTLLLFIVAYSLYYFTYKGQKTFFNKIESLFIIILIIIFFILYLTVIVNRLDVRIIALLLGILAILVLSSAFAFIQLKKSESRIGLIASYLVFAFDVIVLFGFIFSIIGGFPPNALIENNTQVMNAWEITYFSAGNFYAMNYGDVTPIGPLMKLVSITELVFAVIFHIIILSFIIAKFLNPPFKIK